MQNKEKKEVQVVVAHPLPERLGPALIKILEEATITCEPEWDSPIWGRLCGKIDHIGDGVHIKETFFSEDTKKGSIDLFQCLLDDHKLIEEHTTIRNKEGELVATTLYYIPYKNPGHKSYLPTVTEEYVGTSINVTYDLEYEVLFVGEEGYKRYLYIPYKTAGPYSSCLLDHIEYLEEDIKEWVATGTNGFCRNKESGEIEALFFSPAGEQLMYEIENVRQLMMMVNSIRLVQLESHIVEDDDDEEDTEEDDE